MNKTILLGIGVCFFFILLFPSLVALEVCTDTNEIDIDDIPCQGLTIVINCTGNVTVLNLNTSIPTNLSTELVSGGILNFTFDFNKSSYSVTDCANNSASIIVGDFPRDDLWKTAMIIGFLGIAFIIILMARISFDKDRWVIKTFMYICGSLIALISIQSALILSRVSNVTTMVRTSIVISITSISIFFMYILIYYTIDLVKSFRTKRKVKEEEEDEED